MRKHFLLPLIVVAGLVLVGCNVSTSSSTNTSTNPTSATDTSDTPIDSCTMITAADVSTTLGLTVTAKTTAIGSCNLVGDDGTNILLQVVNVNLYNPAQYPNTEEVSGIGDKAFVQNPEGGRSVNQAYSKGKTFIFNIFSTNAYSKAQVQALMKLVVARG